MSRPRLLLVPTQCEIEWQIRPLLEEWADVAAFDPPGVTGEPAAGPLGPEGLAKRGLAEVEQHGWDRYTVVGDEFGIYHAVQIAAARPEAVQGLALGHACLSLRENGRRAPINGEVWGAMTQLRDVDYRTYARHLTQVTQDAYNEEVANEYMERVPQEVVAAYDKALAEHSEESLRPSIESLAAPLLFARHVGCLVFTDEGWEDAVEAFPEAKTTEMAEKPSTSAKFVEELRSFCEGLEP